jgi:hypothetical protein
MTHIQEALGMKEIKSIFLLRGSVTGMSASVFHTSCDNRGPLLMLFKTGKDIYVAFSSIPWNSGGVWTVDKNCFILSLKLRKIYKPQNDNTNLYFDSTYGPWFGAGPCLGMNGSKI